MSVVVHREREAGVAGRAERLAGHERDLGLAEDDVGELERVARPCPSGRAAGRAGREVRVAVERALAASRHVTPGISFSIRCIVPAAAGERVAHHRDRGRGRR